MTAQPLIPTPLHVSLVPGFSIDAGVYVQEEAEPTERLAHTTYITTVVTGNGSNATYPVDEEFVVHLVFVNEGYEYCQAMTDEGMYITVPASDCIEKLEVLESLEEEGYFGVALRIWTRDCGEDPYFELLLAPLAVRRQ